MPPNIDLAAFAVIAMAPNHDTPSIGVETNYIFDDLNTFYKPYAEMTTEENKVSKFKGRLNKISSLKENWDGYKASVIDQSVIFHSMAFLGSIPSHLISKLEEENIHPTPYGTILIEIENNNDELSIEIGQNEFSFYFEQNEHLISESTIEFEDQDISPAIFEEILDLLENVS
ncbi:MAG: hypothetical protein JJ876_04150 [Muricauda sp.]|nr:hypothetical protein [Allomuricauda sp.]MBO6828734.1 hypothetical protein [Allomuricauda sp.]